MKNNRKNRKKLKMEAKAMQASIFKTIEASFNPDLLMRKYLLEGFSPEPLPPEPKHLIIVEHIGMNIGKSNLFAWSFLRHGAIPHQKRSIIISETPA